MISQTVEPFKRFWSISALSFTVLSGGDGAWAAGNRRAGAVVPAAVSPSSPQCDFLGRRHSRNRHLRVENMFVGSVRSTIWSRLQLEFESVSGLRVGFRK